MINNFNIGLIIRFIGVFLIFNQSQIFSQNIFKSSKHNFSIEFPSEVETHNTQIGDVFISFEANQDKVIMYHLSVINEMDNFPIIYKNKKQTDIFLKATIKGLSQSGYENVRGLSTSSFLFNDKYHSMKYKFYGKWAQLNGLVVYNNGIYIARKKRLYKVTVIYSEDWHGTKEIENKTNNFIDSFNFTDGK